MQETILPICPCGCESVNASELPCPYTETEWPDYAQLAWDIHQYSWIDVERDYIRREDYFDDPLVHNMRHLRLLMPWVTHDPNLVRLMKNMLELKGKKKIHSLMGHASSGKTNYIVVRGYRSIDLWPHNSEVFVASPTKTAGTYLLWNEFEKAYWQFQTHPNKDLHIFRNGTVLSVNNRKAGVGTISFVGLHNVGTMRGKKMFNQDVGELIVAMDEIGEFPNASMLDIIANLKSQNNLNVITGTNFRDLHGLDGRFHEPSGKDWTDLNRETDYDWDTALAGLSSRLRAKMSPNIVMGQNYYPYLLTDAGHRELLQYGENSPEYLSQGDAFPSVNSISRTLITTEDIIGGNTYEDVKFREAPKKFAFLDPSFSYGGDAAVACTVEVGTTEAGEEKIRIINMERLLIAEAMLWTPELIELAIRFRKGSPLKEGTEIKEKINIMDLSSLQYGAYLSRNGVEFNNAAFDDSMRGTLSHAMSFYLGHGVQPISYGEKPMTKPVYPPRERWEKKKGHKPYKKSITYDELYANNVSAMWFTTTEMVRSGHIRNGFVAEAAFTEMKKRLKSERSTPKKMILESKKEYKGRNSSRSPDNADALTGCVFLAVERRMTPKEDISEYSQSGTSIAERMIEESLSKRNPLVQGLSR